MIETLQIDLPTDKIEDFCQRWQITEFALFGSVLSNDFTENSDIDILVSFTDDAHPNLYNMVEMGDELEALFGRKVDLLTRKGVENSANYIRRKSILDTAQVLYGA